VLLVGKINAVYGIKGWVKVYSYTSPVEQILKYSAWTIKKGSKQAPLEFSQSRQHGKGIVVLPEGFDDRNQAESLIGYEIWIDEEQLPDLEPGEYFWAQLEGLMVFNEASELLGEVSHLLETGANDVLIVKANDKSIDDKERLIPYVEEKTILKVDLEEGKILVAWDADY
jgi:16S rRNA processing protein RimM